MPVMQKPTANQSASSHQRPSTTPTCRIPEATTLTRPNIFQVKTGSPMMELSRSGIMAKVESNNTCTT
ncbi:hypothetical protein D3C77_641610 [compost metagenome]